MTEKRLLKISGKYTLIGLAVSLFFWFVIYDYGICHAQTQTGYRVPTRLDIGGGRMTGDMWCQYGTNGVRFIIGTQAVTQVGTAGVMTGTIASGSPSLDFTYGGGSISANFDGFNAVYVAGSQVGTSGALTGKLDAVDGVGTNNTFNNATLAGVGTITSSFGANGLVISPAEYATVNNATSELQAQIDGKQPALINNSPGTITNVLGYTPVANTQGSITTALGYTPVANTQGSITTALGYTPPANTTGSITTALGYTPTDLGNSIALGTETTGNTDNISEGSTNKYYQDARVNAAVGSISVNTLSDVNITFNENDFVKIVGGQLVAGSSSVAVAFPEVTGSASASQLPLISGLSGSATSAQLPLNPTFGSTTTDNLIAGTATVVSLTVGTTTVQSMPFYVIDASVSDSIPTMSSNTAPSGIAYASTEFGASYTAWKAMDNNTTGTYWSTTAGNSTGILRYDYGTGTVKRIQEYQIYVLTANSTFGPQNWTFEGSNNLSTWTVLDTRTGQTPIQTGSSYSISNTNEYQMYRLNITANNGNPELAIWEFEMFPSNTDQVIAYNNGILTIGTTTASSTATSYLLQIAGSGLATSWGVTCYESIKSIIGSGSDVIKEGYDAVMGTKLFKHHPKLRDVSNEEVEILAVNDYVEQFKSTDYETFLTDKKALYTTVKNGSITVNWEQLEQDFKVGYVDTRIDEFYVLPDKNERVKQKKVDLESDTSITSITPVSDDPSTPDIFKRHDKKILDLEPQIGALMGAAQYQDEEIKALITLVGSLTSRLQSAGIP